MVSDRAYLKGARIGVGLAWLNSELERVLTVLQSTGAIRVEPPALQAADQLLDLYGEDIRARAFVTRDDGAEMMLRPDFTVPIVQMHMDSGADLARYAYCGPVWRKQEPGSARPREYLQAGFEIFGASDAASADAEVLGLIATALGEAPVDLVTGDMGVILAAIDGLETSAPRKAALKRHVWRPARFHRLLQRYGPEHAALSARRAGLLSAVAGRSPLDLIAEAGPLVGNRSAEDIAGRVARLSQEAATEPLKPREIALLEAVLSVEGASDAALDRFREIAAETPALGPAVDRLAARLSALSVRGFAPGELRFEASFGRTTLEYYDGFVFGAIARDRPDLPPIATGGRYDAMTRVLGGGRGIPAVGGIIRPEALLALGGAR